MRAGEIGDGAKQRRANAASHRVRLDEHVKQIEDAVLQRIERGDSDQATLGILNHKNQTGCDQFVRDRESRLRLAHERVVIAPMRLGAPHQGGHAQASSLL